jgi:hypothetical protein
LPVNVAPGTSGGAITVRSIVEQEIRKAVRKRRQTPAATQAPFRQRLGGDATAPEFNTTAL